MHIDSLCYYYLIIISFSLESRGSAGTVFRQNVSALVLTVQVQVMISGTKDLFLNRLNFD